MSFADNRPLYRQWPLLALIFAGGSIGTALRESVSLMFPSASGITANPVATAIVNMIGAFTLGFLLEILHLIGPDFGKLRHIRLGIGTGLIGGFTTYSAVSVHHLETNLVFGVIYAFGSVAGGILVAFGGIALVHILIPNHRSRSRSSP